MKKKNILIFLIVIVVLLAIALGVYLITNKNDNKVNNKITDAVKFKNEYEKLNGSKNDNGYTYPKVSLKENNPFVYADSKKVVETLKSGTGLIYLGFPKCPWCRNAVNVLQYVNAGEILYLDMSDERDAYEIVDGTLTKTKEGTKEYYEMLKLLDSILTDYEIDDIKVGEKRIYVPLVIGVKDGKIVGYHADTTNLNEGQTPYDLLTDKQQSELKLIYDEINADVNGDACGLEAGHGC